MGWKYPYQPDFFSELIVDNFAGGGGASTGIARCGNSVQPQFAEQLVRANLPELCVKRDLVASM